MHFTVQNEILKLLRRYRKYVENYDLGFWIGRKSLPRVSQIELRILKIGILFVGNQQFEKEEKDLRER